MKWLRLMFAVLTPSPTGMNIPHCYAPLHANSTCPTCTVSKLPVLNATNGIPMTKDMEDVFHFLGFASNQQRLAQAKVAVIEAAQLLYIGLVAITMERDAAVRTENYKRYFPDDASIVTVWDVIATMYQQVAAFMFPRADFPHLDDQNPPYPDLLPLNIFNKDPSRPNRCIPNTMAVFSDERLYPWDPTGYVILCDDFFDKARGRSMKDVQCDRLGPYMNEYGEGIYLDVEGAGAAFGGAIIVHELLHWKEVTAARGGPIILDNWFLPPGFPTQVKAYTPWQCKELKVEHPQVATLNDNNYVFYMLEAFWTRECQSRGTPIPPWESPPQGQSDAIPPVGHNAYLRLGDVAEFSDDWSAAGST